MHITGRITVEHEEDFTMFRCARTFIAFAIALAVAGPVSGQIYSPPPPLMGQPSFHLYSVPGLMDAGVLATFFACTNTTPANIRVGVEVFAEIGGPAFNDPSATSLDLLPGVTAIFGTSSAVGISISSNLQVAAIFGGSARVLATKSKGIMCTAFLADPLNAPPTSMVQLTIIAKLKQKAAN